MGSSTYTRGGAYKIIEDIKKILLKDFVYFSSNFLCAFNQLLPKV